MFEIIDDLKAKLDQHRPLSPAIEGNTLTYFGDQSCSRRDYGRGKALRAF
jgi:hypothetical protein